MRQASADGSQWCWQAVAPDGTYLMSYSYEVEFGIDPTARRVEIVGPPDGSDDLRRHLLIDQIVPHLVAVEGRLILHASGVVHGGHALALTGMSGAGKSSLAAAFVGRGAELLADDYLLVERQGERYLATGAYPGLRLWRDSAAHFGGDADELPQVAPHTDKRRLGVDGEPSTDLPLGAIVVLGPEPDDPDVQCTVERLRGRRAFVTLYLQVFRMERTGRERQEADLDRLTHLVRTVPLFLLRHRRDYDALPSVLATLDAALDEVGL